MGGLGAIPGRINARKVGLHALAQPNGPGPSHLDSGFDGQLDVGLPAGGQHHQVASHARDALGLDRFNPRGQAQLDAEALQVPPHEIRERGIVAAQYVALRLEDSDRQAVGP